MLRIGGSPVLRSKPGGKAAPWDCLGPIYWEAARITDMSSTPWAILRPAITVIISNWSVLNIRCVENALTLTLITCGGHYDYNAYFIHKETERPLTQSHRFCCAGLVIPWAQPSPHLDYLKEVDTNLHRGITVLCSVITWRQVAESPASGIGSWAVALWLLMAFDQPLPSGSLCTESANHRLGSTSDMALPFPQLHYIVTFIVTH